MNRANSDNPLPPINLRHTLRQAVRSFWDALGLVIATSITFFAIAAVAATMCAKLCALHLLPTTALGLLIAFGALFGLMAPTYVGICYAAHGCTERRGAAYNDILFGFGTALKKGIAVAVIDVFVTGLLLANIAFYATRSTIVYFMLALLFIYAFIFWAMNLLYHVPLLVVGEVGVIKRDDGKHPTLFSIYRNGFLLTASAPAYSFGVLMFTAATFLIVLMTGVGAVLLGAGITAFYTTSATRDQLVRLNIMEPLPDIDSPVDDERWRLK